MPNDSTSAVPHMIGVNPNQRVGASMPQHLCTACGQVVHVPAGVCVPCGWCGRSLTPVAVAGEPVARDKEYASYMR